MEKQILAFFPLPEEEQRHWLVRIGKAQWRAAAYLHELLKNGQFRERYGDDAELFLLTCGTELLAFCTLTRRDEIPDETLYPWIGFVYTDPECRGHRYSQRLIDHACDSAGKRGHPRVYLTSDEVGLYEKYGFVYLEDRRTVWDSFTRLFAREL